MPGRIRNTGSAPVPTPQPAPSPGKPGATAGASGGWAPRTSRRGVEGQPAKPTDRVFDGFFVGPKGVSLPPSTPLSAVARVIPGNGKADGFGIYVNGVLANVDDQSESLQELADTTGKAMVGIHNATAGLVNDAGQVLAEKLSLGGNDQAIALLKGAILEKLDKGEPLTLFGHSQGCLVVAQALTDAKAELLKRGLSLADAEQKMSRIQVETFGAAASVFPDGPQYMHYVNAADPISSWLGTADPMNNSRAKVKGWGMTVDAGLAKVGLKTSVGETVAVGAHELVKGYAGRGAVMCRFTDKAPELAGQTMGSHLLVTYLKHRLPFEEARAKYGPQYGGPR